MTVKALRWVGWFWPYRRILESRCWVQLKVVRETESPVMAPKVVLSFIVAVLVQLKIRPQIWPWKMENHSLSRVHNLPSFLMWKRRTYWTDMESWELQWICLCEFWCMWELWSSLFSVPDLQVPVCCTWETAPPPASDEIYFLHLEDPVMALTLLREKM